MGVGSIPDSPPPSTTPAGETAEDRERKWMQMDQQKSRQQQLTIQQPAQTEYSNSGFDTVPAPPAAVHTPGLYPQPIAGVPIRGK